MRKVSIICLLALGLLIGTSNFAYSNDLEKIQTITEIGTLANNNNLLQALDECNEALKKYPQEADLYYWRATIQNALGQKQESLKDFDKAVELNPNESNYLVMRGICKSELNDKKGAETDINKAIELNPKNPTAYFMRASLKLASGDFAGADEDLNTANKLFEVEKVQEQSK